MKSILKTELKTWLVTGRLFLMLVVTVAAFTAYAFKGYSTISAELKGFAFFEEHITREGEMERILGEPLFENGQINAILNDKQTIERNLYALSPQNALVFCEEVGIYLFPLIMIVFGALTICSDQSTKILRARVSREGKWRYFFGKQLVMFIVATITAAASVLIYRIIAVFVCERAKGLVTSRYIDISGTGILGQENKVLCMLFMVVYIAFFTEIGFCLGYLFNSPIVPLIAIGYFWFINLVRMRYDIPNDVYNIAHRLFTFSGPAPSLILTDIPLCAAVISLLLIFVIVYGTTLFVWKKRSAY